MHGWVPRLFFWMFRARINAFAKSVLSAGFERSIVNSQQFHELAGIVDRRLFPEYSEQVWPRNNVVQENIVCGGDCAGGDINK